MDRFFGTWIGAVLGIVVGGAIWLTVLFTAGSAPHWLAFVGGGAALGGVLGLMFPAPVAAIGEGLVDLLPM